MEKKTYGWKGVAVSIAIACVAIVCWSQALRISSDAQARPLRIGLRYSDAKGAALSALAKENAGDASLPYVAWVQDPAQLAREADMASAPVELFSCYGDASLLLPREGFLYGHAPAIGDAESCALSKTAAYALYGAWDVIGKAARIGDADYVICGVFDMPMDAALIQCVGGAPEKNFPAIECALSPESDALALSAEEQAKAFAQKHSLPEAALAIDYGAWDALIAQFALLPGWLLLFLWTLCAWRSAKSWENVWRERCALTLAALLCFGFGVCMLRTRVRLPGVELPTRWSDFEFWSARAQALSQSLRASLETPSYLPDMQRQSAIVRCLAASAAASLLFPFAYRRSLRPTSYPQLFTAIGLSLIAAFAASLWSGISAMRAFWLCWPCAILLRFAFEALRKPEGEPRAAYAAPTRQPNDER